MLSLTGCSSVMTHAGPNNELYSGTKNNVNMLPYDYYTQHDDNSDNSPKERIKKLGSTNDTLNTGNKT